MEATTGPGDARRGDVQQRFRRAMFPLAMVTGLLLAVLPPALSLRGALQREGAVAERTAEILAMELAETVARQPGLWRYNAPKVIEGARLSGWLEDGVEVRVRVCAGDVVAGGPEALSGRGVRVAPVLRRGEQVGAVEVRSAPVQRAVLIVAALSAPFGVAMGIVLWWVPAVFVGRQARSLRRALGQLELEKRMVDALNDDLHVRVDAAQQEVRALGERVSRVQDDERRRIARELHDGLGQSLTALDFSIERDPGAPRDELRPLVERAAGELRRSVHDLRPPELLPTSLRASVERIAEDFEVRTSIAVPRRWRGPDVIPGPGAVHVVRVLQEALQNAARHGSAEEIAVDVRVDADVLRLRVEDDGCGFEVGARSHGMGLATMRDRARLCEGDVTIESEPEGGCVIEARFGRAVITGEAEARGAGD